VGSEARSAEEPNGGAKLIRPFLGALRAEEPLIDRQICPDIIILAWYSDKFPRCQYQDIMP